MGAHKGCAQQKTGYSLSDSYCDHGCGLGVDRLFGRRQGTVQQFGCEVEDQTHSQR